MVIRQNNAEKALSEIDSDLLLRHRRRQKIGKLSERLSLTCSNIKHSVNVIKQDFKTRLFVAV